MATCINSSWSCLPPFYIVPIFPLLNRIIYLYINMCSTMSCIFISRTCEATILYIHTQLRMTCIYIPGTCVTYRTHCMVLKVSHNFLCIVVKTYDDFVEVDLYSCILISYISICKVWHVLCCVVPCVFMF